MSGWSPKQLPGLLGGLTGFRITVLLRAKGYEAKSAKGKGASMFSFIKYYPSHRVVIKIQ